jgi:ABC-type glycerol-3-phosphate transport system permease component
VVPLSTLALAALAAFTFREVWDQYVWPSLMVTHDSLRTVPLSSQLFESAFGMAYNEVMAVTVVSLVPIALLFLFVQRIFLEGATFAGMNQ